ncbi:hypothetical protein CL621_03005 [archaeon]|nr:hypothetical protein [archaeon]|tara:strand:- start:2009 stop:2863 length:855 start_codon:yes stop_codon:yes gene_type:complete
MKANKKISVVLTRYNESNKLINPCLIALSKQKKIIATVYFLDQKKNRETKELCEGLTSTNIKIVYKNIPAKPLSYARNLGINLAKTELVLFIDCDAIPTQNWAFELAQAFEVNKKIAIAGGKSVAKWLVKPKWYHKSNILMDMYSTIDLGNGVKETEKIVGVNFGLNKGLLKNGAFFDENLGRRPGSLMSGEESDLCSRSEKKGFLTFYTGRAIVKHQIQKDRMQFSWVLRRFYYAGCEKAILGGIPKTYNTKRNIYDRLLLPVIVIPYLMGFLRSKIKNAVKT